MLWIITGLIISYLIGSIPTAYLFGRFLKGIDIRNFGSGNVGATNALRVLGKKTGIAVLILDILKGFTAVFFVGGFIVSKIPSLPQELLLVTLGLSCICGHNWTIFLNFKGGKGIAATLGVLIGLAVIFPVLRIILVLVILSWLIVILITRIVSIASVVAGIALPIYMVLFRQSKALISASILLCLFAIIRHRPNLKRFFQGKEPRLNFHKTQS